MGDTVNNEVGRLSAETASILAQTVKRVERRQSRCEQRQGEMLGAIREMSQNLQRLQSEASSLVNRLQRHSYERGRITDAKRGGRSGTVMPGCLSTVPAT